MDATRKRASEPRNLMLVCALALSIVSSSLNANDEAPRRVVSTNLCTDQLAMLLAAPGQLYSVSHISHDPTTSVLSKQARRIRANHGLAEEIFLMQPGLILTGAFTRRATTQMLRRLGCRVETFFPAQSLDGIRSNITRIGSLLRRNKYATKVIENFNVELRQLSTKTKTPRKRVALYYANNYTSGTGTLAADIVSHAGLDNIANGLGVTGLVKLPLELLVLSAPEVIITEQPDRNNTALAYEAFAHPALRAAVSSTTQLLRTDKKWSCGAPFTLDAIRALKTAVKSIRPASPATDKEQLRR